MSATPAVQNATGTEAIPIRRVLIQDPAELPAHYSSTPGGTLYSTTPGGTKIVYEKNFLLSLRNSPISKTPPTFEIPDALQRNYNNTNQHRRNSNGHNQNRRNSNGYSKRNANNNKPQPEHEDEQFQMDL